MFGLGGYQVVNKLSRFESTPDRDEQMDGSRWTDRQTDRQTPFHSSKYRDTNNILRVTSSCTASWPLRFAAVSDDYRDVQ